MHHNYIAGYSIKNDIFLSQTPAAQKTTIVPEPKNERPSRLERSELMTRPENENFANNNNNNDKYSFRRVETNENQNNPNNNYNVGGGSVRINDSYYNSNDNFLRPGEYDQARDQKDSLIIYRYKGENMEIK